MHKLCLMYESVIEGQICELHAQVAEVGNRPDPETLCIRKFLSKKSLKQMLSLW